MDTNGLKAKKHVTHFKKRNKVLNTPSKKFRQ